MQYKLFTLYGLLGLEWSEKHGDPEIAYFPSTGVRAFISSDPDEHLFEADRHAAVGTMMLKRLVGQSDEEGSLEERIGSELDKLRKQRRTRSGTTAFLIFEAEGYVSISEPSKLEDWGDFVVAFDVMPEEPVRPRYQRQIECVLASFALYSHRLWGIRHLNSRVVFYDDDDKPLYAYVPQWSANARVSTGMPPETLETVRGYASVLHERPELGDAVSLLTRSLDDSNDKLLSFLLVWSGLEIFLNKTFRFYEKMAYSKAERGVHPRFLQRIQGVMRDKYRLLDKFIVLSYELSSDSCDEDIMVFQRIKQARDGLMHGQKVEIPSLPSDETQTLFRKYLTLHLQGVGQGEDVSREG